MPPKTCDLLRAICACDYLPLDVGDSSVTATIATYRPRTFRSTARNSSGKSVKKPSIPTSAACRQFSGALPLTDVPAMKDRLPALPTWNHAHTQRLPWGVAIVVNRHIGQDEAASVGELVLIARSDDEPPDIGWARRLLHTRTCSPNAAVLR